MILNIMTSLKTAKLFGGRDTYPVNVGFMGNKEEQSFYVCLTENSYRNLSSVMGSLDENGITQGWQVKQAALLYTNEIKSAEAVIKAAKSADGDIGDKALGLLSDRSGDGAIPKNSILMWFIANAGSFGALDRLIKIDCGSQSEIVILACFYDTDGGNMTKAFYGELPGILLFNTFNFENIRIKYILRGENEHSLELDGSLCIRLAGKEYGFSGALSTADRGYSAKLVCGGGTDTLTIPFFNGRNFFEFKELSFVINCSYATETEDENGIYYIAGSAAIAETAMNGCIYFDGSSLRAAYISLKSDFTLTRLWNYFFPDYKWDKSKFDLSFSEGTALCCCNAKNGADINGTHYNEGLSVNVFFRLNLFKSFYMRGMFFISEDDITAELDFPESIDLKIISVRGAENTPDSKPSLLLDFKKEAAAERKAAQIKGSVYLLDKRITNCGICYFSEGEDSGIEAELSLPKELRPILGERLTICYSEKKGFTLKNLEELSFCHSALNFVKKLEEYLGLINKEDCEKADLSGKTDKLSSEFNIKPKISTSAEGGKKVMLSLTGTLNILDKNKKTLDSQKLSIENIEINSDFKFENLLSPLASVIKDFIKELFSKGGFNRLEKILLCLFGEEVEAFTKHLVCRKIMEEKTADKLADKGNSGGGADITASFAAGGGTAFGGGSIVEGAGAAAIGVFTIIFFESLRKGRDKNEKLLIPKFCGDAKGSILFLNIERTAHAKKYIIDILWGMNVQAEGLECDRRDLLVEYYPDGEFCDISLLEIPVYGDLYIAVRAIHENEKLSSDWSKAQFVTRVTEDMLIRWAYNSNYCLRDCYNMLKRHNPDLDFYSVVEKVMAVYGKPDTPKEIAQKHFKNGDFAEVCLEHIEKAHPNLSSKEIIRAMWFEGYCLSAIEEALISAREGLTAEETDDMFKTIITEVKMEMAKLNMDLKNLIASFESGKINKQELFGYLTALYAGYDGVEFAAVLKDAGANQEQIAEALKAVYDEYSAVTIGGIILDERVYPNTDKERMRTLLTKLFDKATADEAISILYTLTVVVEANIVWNDTGIDINFNEFGYIKYVKGRWTVNPHLPLCEADGNGIIAKPGYALPGKPEGCLIGKIGDGAPFYIGMDKAVFTHSQGRLYLGANDDVECRYGCGYADNVGNVVVEIRKVRK